MALPARPIRKETPKAFQRVRPALKVVAPPSVQRAKVPFFFLCLAILMGAMLTALVLNTVMASSAYTMHSTEIELARTLQSNAERAAKVDQLSAPGRVAQKARELGMVPGAGVIYMDLETGQFIGSDADTGKDS